VRPRNAWFASLRAAVRNDADERPEAPNLTEDELLAWADEHERRTGRWPERDDGPIPGTRGETWLLVAAALSFGLRGIERRTTLARFFKEHRGRYHRLEPPDLTEEHILAWADEWYNRTGEWPGQASGDIPGTGGCTWAAVNCALVAGRGGLPGGTTLARFLYERRGRHDHLYARRLNQKLILAWADRRHERTGQWPTPPSGLIPDSGGLTWRSVDLALRYGRHGLRGGSSLARLLARKRAVFNVLGQAQLTVRQVLVWADQHHRRTGAWPKRNSGPISGTKRETWSHVDQALSLGLRGLPGGSSLARLLKRRRGVRNKADQPPLTVAQILAWADAHQRRTGKSPLRRSGPVTGAPGEAWSGIDRALRYGYRGLPGASSLTQFLAKHRKARNPQRLPKLTVAQILRWADAFHRRTGHWPNLNSGAITDAPGEAWRAIQGALQRGHRGLPGGSTLARLLAERRGVNNKRSRRPDTDPQKP